MKKKIIICVFSILILITAIAFIIGAIDSYNYDMDPNNGVDIFEGLGAVLITMVGGFVVFYELDLFYTTYYFFIKPKTKIKTILNILANFSLVLIFVYSHLSNIFMELRVYEITPVILFWIYVVLRIIYLFVSTGFSNQEK